MRVQLEGAAIQAVRRLSQAEREHFGWEEFMGVVIDLDNGVKLYASSDEEGNGAGCLFGVTPDNREFIVNVGGH